MKTFFKSICACLALVGLSVHAAPIVQSGWTTTGVPATARDALFAAPKTNAIFYDNGLTSGAFGTPRYRFWQSGPASFALFDAVGPNDIFSWNNDILTVLGGVTATDFVANNSITLGGETRTTWPTLSGAFSPATNIIVKTADNNPSPDQGAALVIRPQEVSSNPGVSAVWVEYLPTYTNDTYKGKFRHTITAVTNTLGDLLPDINWNINYNGGGNSAGVSTYGPTDTNEPVWIEQKESRWQNLGSLSQLEWWDYFATPYTPFGTNFGMRWWTGTLIWGTTNKNYVRAEAKATVSTLEIQNPTATNGLAGVLFAADNAQQQSYTLTIDGGIVIRTNEAGNGSLLMKGGFLSARAPDSVSSLGGVNIEADWNNSDNLKPHGLVYNNGSDKSLYLGKPGDSSKTFTNVVVASNFVALGYATFPRGISANSNVFVLAPTNFPSGLSNVIIVTGTNAAGAVTTAWGPQSGSGSGGYSGWETNTALANSFLSTNVLIASGGIHATQQNNTIGAILGTTAADNAPAGTYGEYVESKIASGSAVSLTTATAANITSISLTAGDWDVEGSINFSQGAATATATVGGINTTSATLPTDGSEVNSGVIGTTITVVDGVTLPRRRVNVSATTTVYLVGRATFSAGTVTGYGVINARRIR